MWILFLHGLTSFILLALSTFEKAGIECQVLFDGTKLAALEIVNANRELGFLLILILSSEFFPPVSSKKKVRYPECSQVTMDNSDPPQNRRYAIEFW